VLEASVCCQQAGASPLDGVSKVDPHYTGLGSVAIMAKKTRDKPLRIWVSAEMRETIKKLAEADRRPVSTWIMLAIERAIEEAKRKK
jgi:hypothetical protein